MSRLKAVSLLGQQEAVLCTLNVQCHVQSSRPNLPHPERFIPRGKGNHVRHRPCCNCKAAAFPDQLQPTFLIQDFKGIGAIGVHLKSGAVGLGDHGAPCKLTLNGLPVEVPLLSSKHGLKLITCLSSVNWASLPCLGKGDRLLCHIETAFFCMGLGFKAVSAEVIQGQLGRGAVLFCIPSARVSCGGGHPKQDWRSV